MSGVDIAGLVERLRAAINLGDRTGSRGKRPENIYNVADDALTALLAQAAELAEARERHQKQVDYSIDLQRIVEALCDGRMPPEPETSARHHYDMAVEATRQRDEALAALKASEEGETGLQSLVAMFRERIERRGNWDDGCFYYGNTSASELQEPLNLARSLLHREGGR